MRSTTQTTGKNQKQDDAVMYAKTVKKVLKTKNQIAMQESVSSQCAKNHVNSWDIEHIARDMYDAITGTTGKLDNMDGQFTELEFETTQKQCAKKTKAELTQIIHGLTVKLESMHHGQGHKPKNKRIVSGDELLETMKEIQKEQRVYGYRKDKALTVRLVIAELLKGTKENPVYQHPIAVKLNCSETIVNIQKNKLKDAGFLTVIKTHNPHRIYATGKKYDGGD